MFLAYGQKTKFKQNIKLLGPNGLNQGLTNPTRKVANAP